MGFYSVKSHEDCRKINGKVNKTVEYRTWCKMKERCYNKNNASYKNYGGRGIKVHKRWLKYTNFLADMGRRPVGNIQLDRIDNDGDYCKENCRWVSGKMNNRNRRDNRMIGYKGEIKCVAEWAEEKGLRYGVLLYRLRNGWAISDALNVRKKEKYFWVSYVGKNGEFGQRVIREEHPFIWCNDNNIVLLNWRGISYAAYKLFISLHK